MIKSGIILNGGEPVIYGKEIEHSNNYRNTLHKPNRVEHFSFKCLPFEMLIT